MARVLLGPAPTPGFLITLLNVLSDFLDAGARARLAGLRCSPLEEGLEGVRQSGDVFTLLVPVQENLRSDDALAHLTRFISKVAGDVNAGRCRIYFDYCNESATANGLQAIDELTRLAGITRAGAITLVSQNRLLADPDLPIRHQCADFFLVCGWDACRRALLEERRVWGEEAVSKAEARHDVLCLNATPRPTRFYVLLKLAAAGLLDLRRPEHSPECQIPYFSFPGLRYEKGDELDIEHFKKLLLKSKQAELLPFIELLLARAPLRVDNSTMKGNALALEIDVRHYRDSRLSLVTETGLDAAHCRITEKTLKPMALGQPFITFGHRHALECARALGYSTYDDCLDNAYDHRIDVIKRVDHGVASAKAFLKAFATDAGLRQRVRVTNLANIEWTLNGFARHYYERFVRAVVEGIDW
jgi:hypothetical protein